MRCERCRRILTSAASRSLGIGPTCLEAMRGVGLVVGGRPRHVRRSVRQARARVNTAQRDWVREAGT